MATTRKRRWRTPSGEIRERWQVDFVDQDEKRRHKQFERKKDADQYLVTVRPQVRDGTYTPESSSKTIKQAADLWIERARAEGLEPTTIADYQRSIEIVTALIEPDTKLPKLTTPRVEQLRDDLLKGHSRAMAQRTLKHFKAIVAGARRRGLIAHDPAAATKIGTATRHKAKLTSGVDFPTPKELKAILENSTGEAKALLCLACLAGLRASEIRGLSWSGLDLGQQPSVTVAQRANRACVIGSPKSAAARRSVPLGETAARALREWKLAQPPITYREGRERKQRPATLVFGTGTDRPDSLSNIRRILLGPALEAAGVRWYGLHSFRHYAISSWLASGIDLKTCQHWAGHATLALTLDTYGHLIPRQDDHRRIADAERGLFAN